MSISFAEVTSILGFGVIFIIVLMVVEVSYLYFFNKQLSFRDDYLQPIKSFGVVIAVVPVLQKVAPFASIAFLGALGNSMAPFMLPTEWYSVLPALIIYEFWYWVQHYAAHKVRLFWCIHAAHHAPRSMHLLMGLNHNVLESVFYFGFFFGFLNGICGVPVELILLIKVIDTIWGWLLHVAPQAVGKRYGFLEKCMQTPSWHRVHHAKNIRYMDSNFTSITLFWDWLLGTLEPLRDDEPVEYGITRKVKLDSYFDVHFGDFRELWRDVRSAPGIVNKIRYIFMPPGWSHTGDSQTATILKQELKGAKPTRGTV